MKELSIEEKAKRYDEALERAKGVIEQNPLMEYLKKGIEYILPELKESEDEKIRKEIIAFLHSKNGYMTPNEDWDFHNRWIAWLEKQGNPKVDCPQNNQDVNHPYGCIVMEDFNGGEGLYKLNLDYLNKMQVEEVEEMVRMWNKESKTSNENIKACIGMCLTDADEQRFKDYNTNLRDCLAWLEKQGEQNLIMAKSPQLGEQKPAWSEWDEDILSEIIYFFEKGIPTVQHDFRIYVSWLKSLRPQNAWKPSDEQLDSLKEATNIVGSKYKSCLNSLYSELKKLK